MRQSHITKHVFQRHFHYFNQRKIIFREKHSQVAEDKHLEQKM